MGLHSNSLTFVRAQRPTSHTHSLCKHTTHCARFCSSAIERTRSLVTFLFLPLILHLRHIATSPSSLISHTPHPLKPPSHCPKTHSIHHYFTSVHTPVITTTIAPLPALFSPLFPHFHFPHTKPISTISFIFSAPFLKIQRHNPLQWIVSFPFYVGFYYF
jgi:hypothetical protein